MAPATLLTMLAIAAPPVQATQERAETALESLRKHIVEYRLDFNAVLREPTFKDSKRLQLFPVGTWPDVLGGSDIGQTKTFRQLSEDGKGYEPGQQDEWLVVNKPFRAPFQPKTSSHLMLLGGMAEGGAFVSKGYSVVYSKGNIDGVLNLTSYATAVVDGGFRGQLYADSYFAGLVTGDFTGSFENNSSCILYIEGRFRGEARLRRGAKLVVYGRASRADLERVKGTGHIWLFDTDLPTGKTQVGDLTVVVMK